MKASIELERFENKYHDLIGSLALLDFFLKEGTVKQNRYSNKEINLARSIVIRNIYISVYVLFEQFINQKMRMYVNNSFYNLNDEAFERFIFRIEDVVGEIKFNTNKLSKLFLEPKDVLKSKVIGAFNAKKKGDNYIRFINSFFDLEVEEALSQEVQLFISMRHRFVHHEGLITQDWINRYGVSIRRMNIKIKEKGEKKLLPTDYIHLKLALDRYYQYVQMVDTCT
nr:hypothetical protein [uncultured Draconibacterium sp.]